MIYDPATGARMAHRMLIPMATAAEVPSLAERPDAEISDLYQQLADAGLSLEFTERVTARPPTSTSAPPLPLAATRAPS